MNHPVYCVAWFICYKWLGGRFLKRCVFFYHEVSFWKPFKNNENFFFNLIDVSIIKSFLKNFFNFQFVQRQACGDDSKGAALGCCTSVGFFIRGNGAMLGSFNLGIRAPISLHTRATVDLPEGARPVKEEPAPEETKEEEAKAEGEKWEEGWRRWEIVENWRKWEMGGGMEQKETAVLVQIC